MSSWFGSMSWLFRPNGRAAPMDSASAKTIPNAPVTMKMMSLTGMAVKCGADPGRDVAHDRDARGQVERRRQGDPDDERDERPGSLGRCA
jgi:hypothetical protein